VVLALPFGLIRGGTRRDEARQDKIDVLAQCTRLYWMGSATLSPKMEAKSIDSPGVKLETRKAKRCAVSSADRDGQAGVTSDLPRQGGLGMQGYLAPPPRACLPRNGNGLSFYSVNTAIQASTPSRHTSCTHTLPARVDPPQ
jgi:hypothetical protein